MVITLVVYRVRPFGDTHQVPAKVPSDITCITLNVKHSERWTRVANQSQRRDSNVEYHRAAESTHSSDLCLCLLVAARVAAMAGQGCHVFRILAMCGTKLLASGRDTGTGHLSAFSWCVCHSILPKRTNTYSRSDNIIYLRSITRHHLFPKRVPAAIYTPGASSRLQHALLTGQTSHSLRTRQTN